MLMRLKFILLPLAGAISALISFIIAAPFVKSLNRPWLKPSDPEYHFTFGTVWTNVQHAAFGALLCGSFCFILEAGRRSPGRVLRSTVIGAILGAITNSFADSGADLIGIRAMKAIGPSGQSSGMIAWLILVPAALSFSIMVAIGPTKARMIRALVATAISVPVIYVGRMIGSVVGAIFVVTKGMGDLQALMKNPMEASIPAWMCEAVAAGIALGLVLNFADQVSRKGSLRLIYGRNEYKDWALDHAANRIGSGEVEIPVRGFRDVQPVHACIFRQGNQFVLDSQHAPSLLNGHPVQYSALNHGDTISIGEATLIFFGAGAVSPNPRHARGRQFEPMPGMPQHGIPSPPAGQATYPGPIQPGPHPGYGSHPPVSQALHVPPGNSPLNGQLSPVAPVQHPPMPMPGAMPVNSLGAPIVQVPNGPPQGYQAPAVLQPTPTVQCFLNDSFGRQYELSQGPNRIGREATNKVAITNDSTVSRSHAEITIDGQTATLVDLGSANGTKLNGVPVTGAVAVKSGDVIAFGKSNMNFRMIS